MLILTSVQPLDKPCPSQVEGLGLNIMPIMRIIIKIIYNLGLGRQAAGGGRGGRGGRPKFYLNSLFNFFY